MAEKAGLPTVSVVCDGFATQGSLTAAGLGMPNLPLAVHPGSVNVTPVEEMQRNVETIMVDQIVKGLTEQPKEVKVSSEPEPREIVFKGTFEEVNKFFYSKEWGDGLPVVPPTIGKIEEFLKYTDSAADKVLGVLLPDNREATVWNVAVNGVMAGCRPEYMPVLMAVVEAMTDPKFGQEHLGHTPGAEILITVNGPIIKDLDFNYEQGALRVGFQANTAIGRFWRLYLRNVAGFLPHKTDKATFGGTWRVVLAENEDAVARIGWQPMSADQGFKAGDNIITVNSCMSTDSLFAIGAATAEESLNKLAARLVDIQLYFFKVGFFLGYNRLRPQLLLTPCLAEAIAKNGYSKEKMKQYIYQHAVFPAQRFEHLFPQLESLCYYVKEGRLPKHYCESTDPNRLVPLLSSPDDLLVTVSGDPGRDNCFICAQSGRLGYPTSRRIQLPENWRELLAEAKKE